MLQKAKVKETGEIIYVRPPYEGEYISSLYEPDFIMVDGKGNTIYYTNEYGYKKTYEFSNNELELID